MHCRQVHEWMSLELDGQLPPAETLALQAHLASCEDCAEVWARWQGIASLFAEAPMAQPPEDLVERVLVRVQKPRWSALAASLAVMGAGLALLVLLALAPLATACSTAVATAQAPGVLSAAGGALGSLVRAATILVQGAGLVLRAVLTPRSVALAVVYAVAAAAVLVGWLRVAILKPAAAPVRAAQL